MDIGTNDLSLCWLISIGKVHSREKEIENALTIFFLGDMDQVKCAQDCTDLRFVRKLVSQQWQSKWLDQINNKEKVLIYTSTSFTF